MKNLLKSTRGHRMKYNTPQFGGAKLRQTSTALRIPFAEDKYQSGEFCTIHTDIQGAKGFGRVTFSSKESEKGQR